MVASISRFSRDATEGVPAMTCHTTESDWCRRHGTTHAERDWELARMESQAGKSNRHLWTPMRGKRDPMKREHGRLNGFELGDVLDNAAGMPEKMTARERSSGAINAGRSPARMPLGRKCPDSRAQRPNSPVRERCSG